MPLKTFVARSIAEAFLSGSAWRLTVLLSRGIEVVPSAEAWLPTLARAVLTRWRRPPNDPGELASFIEASNPFLGAWRADLRLHRVPPRLLPFTPHMGDARWPVRRLDTVSDVASWLEVDDELLDWFADRRGRNQAHPDEPISHYRRRWVEREGRLPRLLEAPKDRLKAFQRAILHEILDQVPPHAAAQGFVSGRSVRTHAALHQGQQTVVRFDLASFFTHLQAPRVSSLFSALGYPAAVAAVLTGLCTTQTPEPILRRALAPRGRENELFALRGRLATRHLPQGAPTSPALANLTSWALDVRLTALGDSLGAMYSRYADDLVFSGGPRLGVGVLTRAVAELVRDEGFRLNPEKTRVQRAHRRQEVTGLVVNQRVGIPRPDFDRLKAEVHQFDGDPTRIPSLLGKIGWVAQVSPRRGAKLRALLDARTRAPA